MKILTAAETQRLDRLTSEKLGIPSLTLMESAGRAVVDFVAERFAPLESHLVLVVAGRGNNGGDGLVVARLLAERGLRPRVVLLADPKGLKGDAAANLARLGGLEVDIAPDLAAWQRARASLLRDRRLARRWSEEDRAARRRRASRGALSERVEPSRV